MSRILCLLTIVWATQFAMAEVTMQMVPSADGKLNDVSIEGLPSETIKALHAQADDRLPEYLKFYVQIEAEVGSGSLPGVMGDWTVQGGRLLFKSRFPLQPGLTYGAELRSATPGTAPIRLRLTVPKPTRQWPAPRVVHIFPSTPNLPQNLLKFYLHFSVPMAQGSAYRYVQITTDDGHALAFPFLELAEELWDRSGTRLTLLLDPARVKRGLVPREEDGAIFEKGKQYRLIVRSDWPDAQGTSLEESKTKLFTIVDEDFEKPKPENWVLKWLTLTEAPDSPTAIEANPVPPRFGLQVDFPEPLDSALLGHCLTILDPRGQAVKGDAKIASQERRWIFQPHTFLPAGEYALRIDPILEDLAGNSVERAFEVDLAKVGNDLPPVKSRSFSIP